MKRHCNLCCPYCEDKFNRWIQLKIHIQIAHKGLEVPEWVLNELK
jgi:hypothetical protein